MGEATNQITLRTRMNRRRLSTLRFDDYDEDTEQIAGIEELALT